MKKLLIIFFITVWVLIFNSHAVHAQMMGYSSSTSGNVSNSDIQAQQKEEQKGKNLFDKLNSKQLTCQKLTSDNFEKIGEYFMGKAIGNTSEHVVMNNMIKSMRGQQGEEQMHIAWGERGSGCSVNTSLPFSFMNMMRGGGNSMMGYGDWNNMTGGWGGLGFGWIFMIIFWILIILGVIALIRYLAATGQDTKGKDKTPVEILKERYAKGEITKKEFGEIKRDLE